MRGDWPLFYERVCMSEKIDVAGLVDCGALDLATACKKATWRPVDTVATFTMLDSDEPRLAEVRLEETEAYGLKCYRWAVADGSDVGKPTLDADEAREAGQEYAEDEDDVIDLNMLADEIAKSGYFGDATPWEISNLCEVVSSYSEGYFMLTKGRLIKPFGRMWTTNGWLESGEYIQLPAYPRPEYVAYVLHRLICGRSH